MPLDFCLGTGGALQAQLCQAIVYQTWEFDAAF